MCAQQPDARACENALSTGKKEGRTFGMRVLADGGCERKLPHRKARPEVLLSRLPCCYMDYTRRPARCQPQVPCTNQISDCLKKDFSPIGEKPDAHLPADRSPVQITGKRPDAMVRLSHHSKNMMNGAIERAPRFAPPCSLTSQRPVRLPRSCSHSQSEAIAKSAEEMWDARRYQSCMAQNLFKISR